MVTIVPTAPLPSGGNVQGGAANTALTYMMNAGDVIQWEDTKEITGTVLQSNNPISFWGGESYAVYDSMTSPGGGGGDSTHQQIPPITAFGSEYAAAPFPSRQTGVSAESIRYRLMAAVTGTQLTFDPPLMIMVPPSIKAGEGLDFETTQPFVVTSQDANHPFYIAQIMPGCATMGSSVNGCSPAGVNLTMTCCLGDEEFVNMLPPAQFLNKYVFYTDITYGMTNLVFVRVKGAQGFQDVSLDCSGTLSGWRPIGSSGKYEMTNVNLVFGGNKVGSCDNGPHTATSNAPFGLTVWGLDSFSSYGYPAGGNALAINNVTVPAVPVN